MTQQRKIIVALDGITAEDALSLASTLREDIWGFKVNDLLIDSGVEIVRELAKLGNVFADPKLHDIPNTVANGVRRLAEAGSDLITVHGSAGPEALEKAAAAAGSASILAITVLTSLSPEDCQKIYRGDVSSVVLNFARMARESGVQGIVCSPQELELLTEHREFDELLKVTPGVRPQWHVTKDDQNRVLTPKQALAKGATHLVIGRPITAAPDPQEALRRILAECSEG